MKKFKLNHSNTFQVYQLLKYGSSVFISIVLAKSYLSVSDLGIFESFLFYASVVSFFWIIGITQALISIFPTLEETNNKTIFFSAFILFSILSLLSFAVFGLPLLFQQVKLFESFASNVYYLFLIYIVINPSGFLVEFILLLKNRFKLLVRFGIITLVIPLLLVAIPAFSGLNIVYCIYGLLIWSIIKNTYLLYLIKIYSSFKIVKVEIIQLIKISSPLIITAIFAGSASYIDSIIIGLNFDTKTFAIFRYGAREFPLFLLLANSFGTSMIPQLAKREQIDKNLQELKSKSRTFMHVLFPLAIGLLLCSQYFFTFIFNKNLIESHMVFDIYLLLIISRFVFPQTILMAYKKNNLIMFISLTELIVNISASLILLKYFGYLGVAMGTVIAYFFEKMMLIIIVKDKIRIPASKYIPFKELFIYSFMLISLYIFKLYYINQ
jgi:O-antigen/teichoic acid export membrane protein